VGYSNYVHLTGCAVVKVTDKAMLVDVPDHGQEWIPLSQIADEGDNLKQGDTDVTVSITEWFAKKANLEGGE
jgi:hypothetical protein